MGWFGPSGNCGCCEAPLNCGCWNDIGDSPVLMIDLDIAESYENYRNCSVGGTWYCRVQEAIYGVGLQGSVSVPLKRVCDGSLSRLVFDIEETYRPIEGSSSYWFESGGGSNLCGTLQNLASYPYWIEVRKETSTVVLSAFNIQRQIYPALVCQRDYFSWWLETPDTWTPENPVQPGLCGDQVTSIERLGSFSWEIVPGA